MVIILVCCILPVSAITVTDDAGTVVTINATPLRIVSLAPSNTEILAALGLLDRVVGVTDVCDYPPEVKNIARIGGYSAISTEKVAAARPDLVIASDITPQLTINRLRELGLTVVVIAPRNIDHVIRDIRVVGDLTGTGSRADQLAANLSARIAATVTGPSAAYRPTVAHVVWHDPLYVSGNDTLQNDVITRAGGENVFAYQSGWGTVPLEEFLMKNPDIIIVNGGGGMDASENDVILHAFMTNPQYASLSAVRNNHVYAVDADIISRAGPRIVDATEQVARIIHTVEYPEKISPQESSPAEPIKSPGFTACAFISGLLVFLVFRWR
jgi:iron complex transport system substrate-binding protein